MKRFLVVLLAILLLTLTGFGIELKINTVTAKPFITGPGGRVLLRCDAKGSRLLAYEWIVMDGKILKDYGNGVAIWQAPEKDGAYKIRVIVDNGIEKVEGEVVVKVDSTSENRPPFQPDVIFPKDGVEEIPLDALLFWGADDPDGDVLFYNIYLSTATPLTEPIEIGYFTPDYPNTFAPELESNKWYYWKIVADDGRGMQSESPVWSFRTFDFPPELDLPEQVVTEGELLSVNLEEHASDPDSADLSFALISGPGTVENSSYSYTPDFDVVESGPDASRTFLVKIGVTDDYGKKASSEFVLTVLNKNRVPFAPFNCFPADGATELPTDTVLSWASKDLDGDELFADLYLGESPDDLQLVDSGIQGTVENVDETGAKDYAFEIQPILKPHTRYFWKVDVYDYADSTSSEIMSFETLNHLPELSVPDQEATETETVVVKLGEYAHDPDGDSLSFKLVSGVGALIEKEDGVYYEYKTDYYASGTYIVEIEVSDGIDSVLDQFTVTVYDLNQAPMVDLVSPVDEATDQGLELTLRWIGKDLDGDKIVYDVYYGIDGLPDVAVIEGIEDTSVTVTLEPHSKYVWKVVAHDVRPDSLTGESQTWSFTTLNNPPDLLDAEFDIKENETLEIDFRDYTTEIDGDPLAYELLSGNGTLTPEGLYSWTPSFEASGTHFIKVSVTDGIDGAVKVYRITVYDVNRMPTVELVAPENGAVFDAAEQPEVKLTWNASDPDGDKLLFNLYITDLITGETLSFDALEHLEKSFALKPHTNYQWKVKVWDDRPDSLSSETDVWSFGTINHKPEIAIPDVSINEGATLTVNLLDYASDVDGDVLGFEVVEGPGEIIDGSYVYTPDYDTAGEHLVKVSVTDSIDEVATEFTITVVNVPQKPILIEPENGTIDVTPFVTLKWTHSEYDYEGILYDVYFGETADSLEKIAENTADTELKLPRLEYGKTYYWKVVAKDNGFEAESDVWSFTPTIFIDVLWKHLQDGLIYSSAACLENSPIYNIVDGKLYAYNPENGEVVWKFETGAQVEQSTPSIDDYGTIYFGTTNGVLYAVNPDGTEKWSVKLNGKINASPAISGDRTIYIGTASGYFYAVSPAGTILWELKIGSKIVSSPAVGNDGTVYFGAADKKLYAVDYAGNIEWSFETGDWVESSPAIAENGDIIFGSDDGILYRVDRNGNLVWTFETANPIRGGAVIGPDGTVYVGSYDWKLYAINPDGTERWSFETNGPVHSVPTLTKDGNIIFGSMDGVLYSLKSDGSIKWRLVTDGWIWASPLVTDDGTVYIGSHDRYMYALSDDNGGIVNGQWPTFALNYARTGNLQPVVIPREVLDILSDSLYIVKLKEFADFNVETLVNNGAVKTESGYVVWESAVKEKLEALTDIDGNIPIVDLGEASIKYVVDENGNLYAGPVADTAKQLALLAIPANLNYKDFEGNYLSTEVVSEPKDAALETSIKTTLLMALISEEYKELLANGVVTGGPENYYEFYNEPVIFYNATGTDITITRAWLIHIWKHEKVSEEYLKYADEWNEKWSPIVPDASTGIEFSKTLKLTFEGVETDSVFVETYNENFASPKILLKENETILEISGIGNTKSTVLLDDEFPTTVEMKSISNWLVTRHVISIATLGGIVEASASEIPADGYDQNPQPEQVVFTPGTNR